MSDMVEKTAGKFPTYHVRPTVLQVGPKNTKFYNFKLHREALHFSYCLKQISRKLVVFWALSMVNNLDNLNIDINVLSRNNIHNHFLAKKF